MQRVIHSHKCENIQCENLAAKDRHGNYKTYCSDECKLIHRPIKFKDTYANKDMDAILAKRKTTNIEKFGVDNASKNDSIRERLRITTGATAEIRTKKTKNNNLEKYGVESTNSLQSVKDKKKESFLEKYGVDHQLKIPSVAAAVSLKNTENAPKRLAVARLTKHNIYGDENYNNRDKYKETCVEKFGVENPSQNIEIHTKKIKNGYKSKQYIMPSGKIIYIQGWENKALDDLLKEYTEDEICAITADIPRITYYDERGKKHYYFPDFYIPKDNLIIEIKSEWTYNKNIPRHNMKRDACLKQGYSFKFMIYQKSNEFRQLECKQLPLDCITILAV